MSGKGDAASTVERLISEFEQYDQYVDIVSAFEWVFTCPIDMAKTVQHFERFPEIAFEDRTLTPDFTVVFTDNTGLIGEIAKISLKEASVDSACAQIGNYARLERLPDGTGNVTPLDHIDIMQIVPFDVGPDAVRRIIHERYLNPDHDYKPERPPCIVQYGRDSVRYSFQALMDPANGTIEGFEREPHVGARIHKLNVRADSFKHIKSARKFMNDPIPSLYLATHLWTSTWPTIYKDSRDDIVVDPADTALTLRQQFGRGKAVDVRNALTLLGSAGLAVPNGDGTWTVSRKSPRFKGESDIHKIIALKSGAEAPPVVKRREAKRSERFTQGSLF